jgi:hypothetical protein
MLANAKIDQHRRYQILRIIYTRLSLYMMNKVLLPTNKHQWFNLQVVEVKSTVENHSTCFDDFSHKARLPFFHVNG